MHIILHCLLHTGHPHIYQFNQVEQAQKMNERFEELIDSFIQKKVGVSDNFLSTELAALLQSNLQKLYDEGNLAQAGISATKLIDHTIRKDKIYWIDKKNKNLAELEFLAFIDEFISYLNKTCYTGINAYEFHYAVYEEGSYYKRHKDQFKNNSQRKFSLISYLNNDWIDTDGGHLMIYTDDKSESILPVIKRSVFFQSDELEHEVAIAKRMRMSVTGWLKRV